MFAGEDRPEGRARSALLAGSSCLELGYGRFMQTDPLGYDDGLNWYNYVGSDPIDFVDPTGLKGKEIEIDGRLYKWACVGSDCHWRFEGYADNGGSGGGLGLGYGNGPAAGGPSGPTGGGAAPRQQNPAPQNVWSRLTKRTQRIVCGALSYLPTGTSLSLGASAQAYGGIGGYLSYSAFVDRNGNTGFNISYGWGAGLGALAGAGVSLGSTPTAGHTSVDHMQGGIGIGPGGASLSYSKSEGSSGSIGVSAGPDLGYAYGSVHGSSDTTAGGNICK